MSNFEIGSTYFARFTSDFDSTVDVTIVARTEKTVTATSTSFDGAKGFKVTMWEGCETIKPLGSYSMAPVVKASRKR